MATYVVGRLLQTIPVLFLAIVAVVLGWLPGAGRVSFFDDPVASLRYLFLPALALLLLCLNLLADAINEATSPYARRRL